MNITIRPTTSDDELYHRYPAQMSPQDAYLYLDIEEGNLRCGVDPEIGGAKPMSVYHQRVLRWPIPPLTIAGVNELLTRVREHATTILAHSRVTWNGSNHVGQFDAVAERAFETIYDICTASWDPVLVLQVYEASDWLSSVALDDFDLSAQSTDDEILEAAHEILEDAGHDGCYVELDHIVDILTMWRDQARDNDDE